METLQTKFRRAGMVQHLVKRTRDVAMYDVTIDDEIIGYEVFIIREQIPRTRVIGGREVTLQHKELLPRNEDFGYTAYAPNTLERANEYFKKLTNRIAMRKAGITFSDN